MTRGMDKQNVVQAYTGIRFSPEKECISSTNTFYNMNEPAKHAKRRKEDTKGPISYDSIYIKYPENGKSIETIIGHQGLGSGCLMGMEFSFSIMTVFGT